MKELSGALRGSFCLIWFKVAAAFLLLNPWCRGSEIILTEPEVLIRSQLVTNPIINTNFVVKSDGTNFLLAWFDRTYLSNSMAARISGNGELLDPFGFWVGGSNEHMTANFAVSGSRYAFTQNQAAPLAVVFEPGSRPFFRTETTNLNLRAPLINFNAAALRSAGNENAFIVMAYNGMQASPRYSIISRDGVPGVTYELPILSASKLKVSGGGSSFVVYWEAQSTWRALVINSDGRILSREPMAISSLQGPEVFCAANDEHFLFIWVQGGYVVGRRLRFDGEFIDPLPISLLRAVDFDYNLFGTGSKWVSTSRYLQMAEIFPVADTLSATVVRPPNFTRPHAVAVNKRGLAVMAWQEQTGTVFQVFRGTNNLGPQQRILQRQRQFKPMIAGNAGGYLAAWTIGSGQALQGAFLDSEGETISTIAVTNSRVNVALRGVGDNGNKMLLLYSVGFEAPLGWVFDSTKASEGGDPKVVSGLFGAAGPLNILPTTNAFIVAATNGLLRMVDFAGRASSLPNYTGRLASSGGRIWSAGSGTTTVTFGEYKGSSGLNFASFGGRNPRVAVSGDVALFTFEITASTIPGALAPSLQAIRFRDGIPLTPRPVTLLGLYKNAGELQYEVAASESGFLVSGIDPKTLPANFPYRRQFMFHIHAESGEVRGQVTDYDAHLTDLPVAAGGYNDFLVLSGRGDAEYYVARQWLLPTDAEFGVGIRNVDFYQQLSFEGDPERAYLLERSTDFKTWHFGDYVMPDDVINFIPRHPGDFQFFRLRLFPQ